MRDAYEKQDKFDQSVEEGEDVGEWNRHRAQEWMRDDFEGYTWETENVKQEREHFLSLMTDSPWKSSEQQTNRRMSSHRTRDQGWRTKTFWTWRRMSRGWTERLVLWGINKTRDSLLNLTCFGILLSFSGVVWTVLSLSSVHFGPLHVGYDPFFLFHVISLFALFFCCSLRLSVPSCLGRWFRHSSWISYLSFLNQNRMTKRHANTLDCFLWSLGSRFFVFSHPVLFFVVNIELQLTWVGLCVVTLNMIQTEYPLLGLEPKVVWQKLKLVTTWTFGDDWSERKKVTDAFACISLKSSSSFVSLLCLCLSFFTKWYLWCLFPEALKQ